MLFDTRGKVHEEIQDPKTGELVVREPIPEPYIKDVESQILLHTQHAQEFVNLSQNICAYQKRQFEVFDLMRSADERVRAAIQNTVARMKLDKKNPWTYNMRTKCMEYRKPPLVPVPPPGIPFGVPGAVPPIKPWLERKDDVG